MKLLFILILLFSISCRDNKRNRELAESVVRLTHPDSIEESDTFKKALSMIEKYEDEINRTLHASQQLGYYYKVLGIKYLEYEMFGKAEESFRNALDYFPSEGMIHYYAGVAIANQGVRTFDLAERERLLKQAEQHYLYAIKELPDERDPYYGLAVLYFFELDELGKAHRITERLLRLDERKGEEVVSALFLYANILASLDRVEQAAKVFDQIAGSKKASSEEKNRAMNSKSSLF